MPKWIELVKEYQSKGIGEQIQLADDSANTLIELGYGKAIADPTQNVANDLITKAANNIADSFSKAITQAMDALASKTKNTGATEIIDNHSVRTKSFGAWLSAVARKDKDFILKTFGECDFVEWGNPGGVAQKAALNSQTGTQGGFVVPSVFYPQLMQIASEKSIVRNRAVIVPMASRSVLIPTLDVTTAPTAGDTAFFGGLVARWTEEAATLNETEPTFKQIELVAHELSGYSKASITLLQDNAIALEGLLMQIFGGAIAWFEDYAFLRGNGVGKPLGITASNASIQVTRSTAGNFKLADASQMLSKLLPGWNPMRTCWIVSNSVLDKLIQMNDAGGNVVWIPNARDPLPMTLFGLPVLVTEKLPALGTADDVLLADFGHYLIGDRMQLEIAASEHAFFTTNQMAWRFVHRIDGQPWLRSAVTLSDASSTVSPFIRLN